MTTSPIYYLKQLRTKYLLLRVSDLILAGLAAGFVTYGLGIFFNVVMMLSLSLAAIVFLLVSAVQFYRSKLHRFNEGRIIQYMNQKYLELEESADLLLKQPQDLSHLQQLQQKKVEQKFNDIYPTVRLPHHLMQSAMLFAAGVLIAALLTSFRLNPAKNPAHQREESLVAEAVTLPSVIQKMEIQVIPPVYTNVSPSTTSSPRIKLPEGSLIKWTIIFNDSVRNAYLVLSNGDSLKLEKEKKQFTAQRVVQTSNFYQVQWKTPSGEIRSSDYFAIEVVKDEAPEIAFTDLKQFTSLSINDNLSFHFTAGLSDDYGLTDSYIIATVSKGSGESVKFREEKLHFTAPQKIHGRKIDVHRSIDLTKLGMEPGDELYFYAEALDNKTPNPNRSRTETYFIVLQDTTSENLSVEGGLGVDLMPEYFRSQRQIIIDTEKLLKEQRQIAKQEFRSRSNELGYDQKVLRLKYGQFLGEEFESGIGLNTQPGHDDHDEDDDDKDITEKYGHVHDKDNEHNHVPERNQEQHHDHHHTGDPEEKENPMDAFLHRHDSEEEATFFNQSIRTKLKAALTVMWDAELYLRLYEPEKSLPFQYQALKLLKEISNDSRIYVHKTGFDPPPLKEDKRLTGDLSEIRSTRFETAPSAGELYPAIRKSIRSIDGILARRSSSLTGKEKEILLQGGNELAAIALEKPGQFLRTLSLIKALTQDEMEAKQKKPTLVEIQNSLWQALPRQSAYPQAKTHAAHALEKIFVENLKALKND